jgi:hypothetical protein
MKRDSSGVPLCYMHQFCNFGHNAQQVWWYFIFKRNKLHISMLVSKLRKLCWRKAYDFRHFRKRNVHIQLRLLLKFPVIDALYTWKFIRKSQCIYEDMVIVTCCKYGSANSHLFRQNSKWWSDRKYRFSICLRQINF